MKTKNVFNVHIGIIKRGCMKGVIIIAILLLFGCANAYKINKLNVGMTKEEVIKIMGLPNSTTALQDIEYLNYNLYETGRDAYQYSHDTIYVVKIKNDKVEFFGRRSDFERLGIDLNLKMEK